MGRKPHCCMKRYYRTYIFEFKKSDGIFYYAGQRISNFENPVDDNYLGSGLVIKRAVKKHGIDCIVSKTWFDHESEEEMNLAEIKLIAETKAKYGGHCTNVHEGGKGGNVIKYASDEQRLEFSNAVKLGHATPESKSKKTKSVTESWKKEGVKDRRAAGIKLAINTPEYKEKLKQRNNDPEYKKKYKELCNRPEVKAKMAKSQRKSPIWEMYDELYELWKSTGMVSGFKFRKIAVDRGYPDVYYKGMVNIFKK